MALPFLFASCSLKVKVRDDWDEVFKRPIPLAEAARTWEGLQAGGEVPAVLQRFRAVGRVGKDAAGKPAAARADDKPHTADD